MVSKFLGVLSVIALAGSSMAGIVSYANAPYTTAFNTLNAPGHAITYASHAPIYQQQQPLVYHRTAAPVVQNQHILAATPTAYYSAPQQYIKSVAPAHLVTKTVVASAPVAAAVPVLKQLEFESSPRYDFSYGVHDSITGDIKSQVETRDGGNVQGAYSVVDADGYKRTVTYTADDINGFNAVVQREPIVAKLAAVATTPIIRTASAVPVVAAATASLQHVVPVQQQYHFVPQAPLQQFVYGQQQLQQQQLFVPQQQYGLQQQYGFPQLAPQQPQAEQQPEAQQEQSPQQSEEQAEQQNELQQNQDYPQEQQFPPQYPQYEQHEVNQETFAQEQAQPEQESANDDSDVIEARSATNINTEQGHERSQRQSHIPHTEQPSSSTAAPAPITEEDQEKPAASS